MNKIVCSQCGMEVTVQTDEHDCKCGACRAGLKQDIVSDRFGVIYAEQEKFRNKVLAMQTNIIFPSGRRAGASALAQFLINEATEVFDSIPWKWWRNDPNYFIWDESKTYEELADLQIVLVDMLHHLHISPEQFFETVRAKQEKNNQRIRDGY